MKLSHQERVDSSARRIATDGEEELDGDGGGEGDQGSRPVEVKMVERILGVHLELATPTARQLCVEVRSSGERWVAGSCSACCCWCTTETTMFPMFQCIVSVLSSLLFSNFCADS